MTKPSDKKPSGSTQGRSRASAKNVDTTPATATETKKPQSKARTSAKKPAAASTAKSSPPKAAPAATKAPRVRSSAAAKKPASTPAPAETPAAAVTPEPAKAAPKNSRQKISALAKQALEQAQLAREAQAVADAGSPTEDETSTRDRNKIEGARLIKMIKKAIVERGLQDRAIADIVGVTQIYWNSLANGNRQIKSLGKEKLQKIAEFLGLPLIQVYLLAEHFTAEDFFNSKDLNEQLWLSIRKMQEDPQWAGYAPSSEEWEQTPINVRITLVSLYERESKRYLMAKAEVEVPGNNFTE
ncbi:MULTISPECIES: helix-turn-helix transcriptional regulator [unclassified Pseudomonas]|uniref:helix-turn-helix domain-containing protein n=1 Tax=unclassified Pseudomonas TaxID=196821 RepID=UPI002115AEE9|nr:MULTISPECIES: helix-turn-helix transcriptional regulator [unclassified Pseudomonas]